MRHLTRILTILLVCLAAHVLGVNKNDATITEPSYYNLANDAVRLKRAMKGWGTDEEGIIEILTHRYAKNRQEIVREYKLRYNDDLWRDIRGETSGDFRYSLKPLVLTESQFLAEALHYAMKGSGTNEDTLINVLMMIINEPHLLSSIKNDYKNTYDKELMDRIKDETSGEFETFLVKVLKRPIFAADVDGEIVGIDVNHMRDAIAIVDIDRIIDILTSRSTAHIKSAAEQYYQATGTELEAALDDITGHHLHDALLSLVSVSRNYHDYLAYELYHSMDRWGTDEDTLTRIIGTRADKDLARIKDSYLNTVGRNLVDDVDGMKISSSVQEDTSGDYRKVLLNLIN